MTDRFFTDVPDLNEGNTLVSRNGAFSDLCEQAESGNRDAQFELALLYDYGDVMNKYGGMAEDKSKAVQWYLRMAEYAQDVGLTYILFRLGHLFFTGEGVAKDETKAIKWYDTAFEYSDDERILRDFLEDDDYIGDLLSLSKILYYQRAGGEDKDRAINWLKMLTDYGSTEAKDELLAIQKSKELAADNDLQSQLELGRFFIRTGMKTQALGCFRAAAEQGDPIAQIEMGDLLHSMPSESGECLKWYRMAAEQKVNEGAAYVAAINLVGVYKFGSSAIPKDMKEAAKWMQVVAEKGNNAMQYELGMAYYTGNGVEQDKDKAIYWLREASKDGNAEARSFLDREGIQTTEYHVSERGANMATGNDYWAAKALEYGLDTHADDKQNNIEHEQVLQTTVEPVEYTPPTLTRDVFAEDNESYARPATEEKEFIHMTTLSDGNVQIDDILKIAKPMDRNGFGKELFKMLDRFTESLGTFSRDYYEACNSRDKDISEQEADAKRKADQCKEQYELAVSTMRTEKEAQMSVIETHRDEDVNNYSSSETREIVECHNRLQTAQNAYSRWQQQQEEEIAAIVRQQNANLSQLNKTQNDALRFFTIKSQERVRKAETEVEIEIKKLYDQVVELIKLTNANADRVTADMEKYLNSAKKQKIDRSHWESILSVEYVKQANELYDAIYNECKKIFRRKLPELCEDLAAMYGRVLSVINTMRENQESKHDEINNDYEIRKSQMRQASQEQLSARRRSYAAEKEAQAHHLDDIAKETQLQESRIRNRYERQIAEKRAEAARKLNEVEATYTTRINEREEEYKREAKKLAERSGAEALERKATWASELEKRETSFIQRMEAVFPAQKMQDLFAALEESKHYIDQPMVSMERPKSNICIGLATVPILSNEDKHGESYPIIVDLLKERYSFMLRNRMAPSLELSIPYMLSVDDGTAFLIKYKDRFEENVKNWVNSISIRMLWSIPASLQEFRLLDTGAIGSYAPLQHLDPAQHPDVGGEPIKSIILGGKVYQKKEDMSAQIEEMRARFETRKGTMGSNVTLREFNEKNSMSREPYQMIIVQHFPLNLNEDSILYLSTLARDCRMAGFSTILAMPDSSENYMEKNVAPRVKDLESYATVLRVNSSTDIRIENGATTESERKCSLQLYNTPDNQRMDQMRDEYFPVAKSALRVKISFDNIAPSEQDYYSEKASQGIVVPMGLLQGGTDFIVRMDDIHIHTVISGYTGSGKTFLLHVLIVSLMLRYSPDEVEIYLVDFKHGIDYGIYGNYNLPNFRVLSITSEAEFPLAVLEEIEREYGRRSIDLAKYINISEYNARHPEKKMKRIVLIIDELYVLSLENAVITGKVMNILKKISSNARAFGIHLVISGQNLSTIDGISSVVNQCANRIVLRTDQGDINELLESDELKDLMRDIRPADRGTCVFSSDNSHFGKLAYTAELTPEHLKEVLGNISSHYNSTHRSSYDLKILLTDPSKSIYHPFSQFVNDGSLPELSNGARDYTLDIGQPVSLIKEFRYFPRQNLWLLGGESGDAELAGYSAMFSSLFSLLLIKLKEKEYGREFEIYCSDGYDDGVGDMDPNDRFWQLCYEMPVEKDLIKYVPGSEIGSIISELIKTMASREADKDQSIRYPIWLLISAAEECYGLREQDRQALKRILDNGYKYNVHVIIWTKDAEWAKRMQMALVPGDKLILETTEINDYGINIRQNNASGYKAQLMGSARARLRLYDLPVQPWVERIQQRLDGFEGEL